MKAALNYSENPHVHILQGDNTRRMQYHDIKARDARAMVKTLDAIERAVYKAWENGQGPSTLGEYVFIVAGALKIDELRLDGKSYHGFKMIGAIDRAANDTHEKLKVKLQEVRNG